MLNKLIKIANALDSKGKYDLANELDSIIISIAAEESRQQDYLYKLRILDELNKRLSEPGNSPERIRELHEAKKTMEERLAEFHEPEDIGTTESRGADALYYLISDRDSWQIVPQTGYANTEEDGRRMFEYHQGKYDLVERVKSPMQRIERIIVESYD